MRGHVLAVVGAQLGSEGKGRVVEHIADKYEVHLRVGAPNAGHTLYYKGQKHTQQSIPCGWVNPRATLVIGRGGLVNPEILLREIEVLEKVDPNIRKRLFIDPKAGCLDPKFHEVEGGTHGEMHQRIGSTGEGVGAARVARMNRNAEKFDLIGSVAKKWGIEDLMKEDTPQFLRNLLNLGNNVLLEGTQGVGLSLIHGPWPYCTSTDCGAAQMAADCGLPPQFVTKVVLVARTFPIRVAGNSGPLAGELTWEELSRQIGKDVIERTTVTKKVRRVGRWDDELVRQAVVMNAPSSIALTFADYLDKDNDKATTFEQLSPDTRNFVQRIEERFGVKVSLISTGATTPMIEKAPL